MTPLRKSYVYRNSVSCVTRPALSQSHIQNRPTMRCLTKPSSSAFSQSQKTYRATEAFVPSVSHHNSLHCCPTVLAAQERAAGHGIILRFHSKECGSDLFQVAGALQSGKRLSFIGNGDSSLSGVFRWFRTSCHRSAD